MDSESLPSCSEKHSGALDTKSPPCEKLKPKKEPDASPPSPRTLLAMQTALLGSSSEDELEGKHCRPCDVKGPPAPTPEGSVSPLTLLAIQRALDDDDEDLKVHASVQTEGAGRRKPRPLVSSSDEEAVEEPKVRDGDRELLTGVPRASSVTLTEEHVMKKSDEKEQTDSAPLLQTVFCQGSESSFPKKQMPSMHALKEPFQTSAESTAQDGKDLVPLESTMVPHGAAPGLRGGPEQIPTPPTSPSSGSRTETYTTVSEPQQTLPPENKHATSVLSSDDETESEKNPPPDVAGTASLQESSNTLSVAIDTVSDLGNEAPVSAPEHENFLKTIQEHEPVGSAGQGLILVPESTEPTEVDSEDSESDGRCLRFPTR